MYNTWEFRDLKIGQLFHLNGCDYLKQSTRTARLLMNDRTFYIGQTETVHKIAF